MRITLDLPDDLLARFEATAAERGETVSASGERAVLQFLHAEEAVRRPDDDLPDFPVFGHPSTPRRALTPDEIDELLHGPDPEGSSEQRLSAQLIAERERRGRGAGRA